MSTEKISDLCCQDTCWKQVHVHRIHMFGLHGDVTKKYRIIIYAEEKIQSVRNSPSESGRERQLVQQTDSVENL